MPVDPEGRASVSVGGREVVRRHLVAAVLVVGLVASGVGAFLVLSGGSEATPVDSVPRDADYVARVDTDAMRESAAVANATRRTLAFQSRVRFYAGPPFLRSFAFAGATAVNASNAHAITYFGRHNSSYGARIVETGWRPVAVAAAVDARHDVALSETTYRGRTIHGGGGYAVADLGNGRLVVGNRTAVRDAVDVAAGTATPVEGPLRRAFERQRPGYVRLAYRFRPQSVPDFPFIGESVRAIEYAGATYYRIPTANGTQIGFSINARSGDTTATKDVKAIVSAGLSFYRFEAGNRSLRRELSKVNVSVQDRAVGIRYRTTPRGLRVMLSGLSRNQPPD